MTGPHVKSLSGGLAPLTESRQHTSMGAGHFLQDEEQRMGGNS